VHVLSMCVGDCGIYSDDQVSRSATRSVRVPDRYGWTMLTVTAMKTRWKTACMRAGASKTALTMKTSRLRATPIYRIPSV